jgi:hypothetical protein
VQVVLWVRLALATSLTLLLIPHTIAFSEKKKLTLEALKENALTSMSLLYLAVLLLMLHFHSQIALRGK